MAISYFVFFENRNNSATRISEADRSGISEWIQRTPGLLKAHVYTPDRVDGPFGDDGPPPQFALQLCFADIVALEAAIALDGHLQALASRGRWPSLTGTTATQQAMLTRSFPVPNPWERTDPDRLSCSYLVHYPGHARDLNAWLKYYLSHHPQLMQRLPGIREIEICTRIDWCDGMPWQRVHHMQRNKLVFDSAQDLGAALVSPALDAMRTDFRKFPEFAGRNLHYPMMTSTIRP